MIPPGRPKITETDVVRAIKQYLQLRGFEVFRRNVGGAFNELRFVRFSEPGQSDLYGWELATGRHLECEVKKPRARTNPKRAALQREWRERAKRGNCVALHVASVLEADEQLAEYGFDRRLLF